MTFRADLHCHSIYSDGTDTPQRLIDLAIEIGLSGLSITDHDTVSAYEEALPYAKEHNFLLLPGVEFSASHHGHSVHILGYGFSLQSEALLDLCEWHQTRRKNRNKRILERLRGLGILIETPEGHTIGRPHIAKAMVEKGAISSIQEAFDKYLGEGRPAYDPGETVSVEKTIAAIHASQGKAIIAHPHLVQRGPLIRQLLKLPFDGIEGYYARFTPLQENKWIGIGRQKGWLITGGSDYHGGTKPFNILGSSWVGKETFDALIAGY